MALLFTLLCGSVALSLGYFINYFAKGHLVHGTQAVLNSEIRAVDAQQTLPALSLEGPRIYIPIQKNGQLPEGFPNPTMRLAEGLLVFDIPKTGARYAARIHTHPSGSKVLIGTNITELSQHFQFMQWLGIASIVFVMLVVFVSYAISIFVVNGTNKIASTAHDIITTGDLSRRVEMHSRWDDLGHVAALLNALFARIEELMKGVRHVSDNIAHDLRTPLTRMRSHIETLQNSDPANTAYEDLLHETDHILTTFNALLRISRIETERQRSQFTTLSLDALLHDVIDFYAPLAEDKALKIVSDVSPVDVYGDRDLLFQAFANILDNAVKFTAKSGDLSIRSFLEDGRCHITVENTSDALEPGDAEKIFQRFYRTDKSRNTSGSGLGLSLVAAVIDLHGGRVYAQSTADTFEIVTIL